MESADCEAVTRVSHSRSVREASGRGRQPRTAIDKPGRVRIGITRGRSLSLPGRLALSVVLAWALVRPRCSLSGPVGSLPGALRALGARVGLRFGVGALRACRSRRAHWSLRDHGVCWTESSVRNLLVVAMPLSLRARHVCRALCAALIVRISLLCSVRVPGFPHARVGAPLT